MKVLTNTFTATDLRRATVVVEPATAKAQFRDVRVEHVTVDGTGKESVSVIGVVDQPHQDLHFTDVRFLSAKPTSIQYLRDSTFDGVVFDNTPDPWVIRDSTGLRFTGTTTTTAVSTDAATGPRWPAGAALVASADSTSATVTWPAATDTAGVAGYRVFNGDTPVATVAGDVRTYTVASLAPALTYHLRVEAVDATGNSTAAGPGADVTTTGTPDTDAPVAGATVQVRPSTVGTTWLRLDWAPVTDDHGVASYQVSAGGVRLATVPGGTTTSLVGGLKAGTTYTFAVTAVDATGNATRYPATATVTTNPPYDTGVPRWPHGSTIHVTRLGATSATLSWPAAQDDQSVIGYRVYVDGQPVEAGAAFTPVDGASTVTAPTFTITGLRPHTSYTVTVEAGDSAFKWTGSGPETTVRTSR